MAIERCEVCDDLVDGDLVEMVECGDGSACLECMHECEKCNELFQDEDDLIETDDGLICEKCHHDSIIDALELEESAVDHKLQQIKDGREERL